MNLVYKIPPILCLMFSVFIGFSQTSFKFNGDSLVVEDIPANQVTELNLSNLGLEVLPVNISSYANLKSLSLHNNPLKSLEGLGELAHLEELDLSENTELLGRIAAQELIKIKGLKYLDVSHCNWRYIPRNIFQLTALQHLDVSDNLVSILPVELKYLTHLTWLDVSHNELQMVSPGLKNLRNLRYLDIGSNSIQNTGLVLQQISVINQLNHLVLDGIAIEEKPELKIKGVTRLEVLNMSYTSSTWMVDVFPNVETLEMKITHNADEAEFYNALSELDFLKSLKVYDDEMTYAPLILGKMKSLETLSIHGFRVISFAEGVFRFEHLKSFELCDSYAINQKALYSDLKQASKLEKVGLKSIGIQEIDEDVIKLQQINDLDFSSNEITRLPLTLSGLKSLKTIDISGNEVVMEDVEALKLAKPSLDIQYNQTVKKIDLVVKPPLENFNVPFENFNISAETGQIINAKTGSRVRIPANAFLNADGSVVSGRVDVVYREFNDPLDMAFAGIPMTFEEDGQEKYFSSAGMLQFDASQNGEPVYANPETPVQVDLVSRNQDPEMDLFFLDPEEQSWINIGKDSISPGIDTLIADDSISSESWIGIPSYPIFPYQREGVNIEMKRDKKNAIYEITLVPAPSWTNNRKQQNVQKHTELEVLNKGKWIIEGTKKERRMWAKRLDSIQKQIHAFNSSTWGRTRVSVTSGSGSDADSITVAQTSTNQLLEDIWVEPNPKKDNFSLCMDLSGELVKIPIIPKRNYGSAHSAQKRMSRIYIPYAKELKQRKDDWQVIEQKAIDYLDSYEKLMDEYSKQMDVYEEQLKRRSALELARIDQETASTFNVTRSISLSGFGFYNCDRIFIIENQKRLLAKLKNEDNKLLHTNNLMVLDNTQNTVFSYDSQDKVRFNGKSVNNLLVFMKGNKVAVYAGGDQAAFVRNKNEPMFLVTYDLNEMTLAEFRKQTGLIW